MDGPPFDKLRVRIILQRQRPQGAHLRCLGAILSLRPGPEKALAVPDGEDVVPPID